MEMFRHHDEDASGMFDKDELHKLLSSQGHGDKECELTIRQWLESLLSVE